MIWFYTVTPIVDGQKKHRLSNTMVLADGKDYERNFDNSINIDECTWFDCRQELSQLIYNQSLDTLLYHYNKIRGGTYLPLIRLFQLGANRTMVIHPLIARRLLRDMNHYLDDVIRNMKPFHIVIYKMLMHLLKVVSDEEGYLVVESEEVLNKK